MNKHIIKATGLSLMVAASMMLNSCDDFLDRPVESQYSVTDYFKNDEQLISCVNTLYASPWNDYLRGFINIGDKLAGNYFNGDDELFNKHSINSGNTDMIQAINSLACVVAHSNSSLKYIKDASGDITEEVRNQCIGEVMVIKAMAYFYMVRAWGGVCIAHNTEDIVKGGQSYTLAKAKEADVYDYIINTVYEAMQLLPKKKGNKDGRIDYYAAEGLLAKVYLQAAAAKDGSLSQACLDKAKEYAADVIENSGRELMANYPDLFRYSTGALCQEGLITLHWAVSASRWTINNWTQPDFVAAIFGGTGNGWGEWGGPSRDLQSKFGVDAAILETITKTSNFHVDNAYALKKDDHAKLLESGKVIENTETDTRRQATMSMYGDYYQYWWRNKGGFVNNYNNKTNVCNDYNKDVETTVFSSPTGAQCVKHVYGNAEDHIAETGVSSNGMCGGLQTHLLRLADVYLVYVEACMPAAATGASRSTSDATALKYYKAVRERAHADVEGITSVSFEELMDERRRELAFEGDNWFDFVRWGDYDPQGAEKNLMEQERGRYTVNYLEKGVIGGDGSVANDQVSYHISSVIQNTLNEKFRLPMPETDMNANPNLSKPGTDYDFSVVEYYKPELYKNL